MPEERNGRVTQEQLYDAMNELQDDLMKWHDWAEQHFVSKDAFAPVKAIVYGLVAIMGTAVVGGILAMVIKSP